MIVECPGCASRYDVTGRPAGTQARCRCGTVFPLPAASRSANQLSCPACGANVGPNDSECGFCHAKLLVKACPRCFARTYAGAKHCASCGADVTMPARVNQEGDAEPRHCPRCDFPLEANLIGDTLLDECNSCGGVWLDHAALDRLVENRGEHGRSVLAALPQTPSAPANPGPGPSGYIKCPDCEQVMNRENFGKRSGVIVDRCRSHGVWFDGTELSRAVEFVAAGGIEKAQAAELERLRNEVRQARRQRSNVPDNHTLAEIRRRNTSAWDVVGGVFAGIASVLLSD